VIFDSDVVIWIGRGHPKAAALVNAESDFLVSVQSYMELVQGARDRRRLEQTEKFLRDLSCEILPLSADIGHRASIYVRQFALSHGLRAGDALIAATAVEYGQRLCTGNAQHFRAIKELNLKTFQP
jgi:hypothetical protein